MLFYRNNPTRAESFFDAYVGPTVTGAMTTANAAYPVAVFNAAIQETSTSAAAILVDMAKCADGTVRPSWITGGVFVRIRTTQPCQIAQRFDTAAGVSVTTTTGYPLAANDTIDLEFDENYRYLEFIWTGSSGTLVHYIRQRPSHPIALADT